ncbi:hypothetical protein pb186bvf_015651 [Paramecium bursaria]
MIFLSISTIRIRKLFILRKIEKSHNFQDFNLNQYFAKLLIYLQYFSEFKRCLFFTIFQIYSLYYSEIYHDSHLQLIITQNKVIGAGECFFIFSIINKTIFLKIQKKFFINQQQCYKVITNYVKMNSDLNTHYVIQKLKRIQLKEQFLPLARLRDKKYNA